jgi:endonuclease/exonuclease/phosphatase family metal-dependent hydrolase
MAAISIVSWNIEHFGKPEGNVPNKIKKYKARVERIVSFLKNLNPDVIALYEIEGAEAFNNLRDAFPGYQFHITEGPQVQEILVGVRGGINAFFTQKVEFKSGGTHLRPGALLTISKSGKNYPILFLHTKSGNDPKGFGLRDDMLQRALDFKKVLDTAAKKSGLAPVNYLFMGDLNTMGMRYPYKKDIDATIEITHLEKRTAKYGMRPLKKSNSATWSNGSKSSIPDSNLDHVIASDHLKFKKISGNEVQLVGWPEQKSVAAKDKWIGEYSDHAALYFEIS